MIHTGNALGFPLLSLTIALPLVGAALVLGVRRDARALQEALGVLFSLMTLVLAAALFTEFEPGVTAFQFTDTLDRLGEPVAWLPGGITYQVGLDGISVVLFLLTALLSSCAMIFSWGNVTGRVREYVALMLVLEAGMLGVFAALDLFLFYVFWELTLIPMVLLIGVWGGADRVYATLKFAVYTLAGSALMLVAIIALVATVGSPTFRLGDIILLNQPLMPLGTQVVFFLAFALAFAVKVPLFPFHTWLPDAHVEAPTAGSVILAGVLLKMGAYGFVRFAMPLFPHAASFLMPALMAIAIGGILYGAWVAYAQEDIKSLVAYSSVSHMGIVMVGLFAANSIGVGGGILQMVNHGLSTGALFLLVGMLYERAHSRRIADFSGLLATMPRFSAVFLLVVLSSIGLPGLNGFVGEWLSLAGAFRANPWYGALAASGVVLSAVYMLWMFQRVFFGDPAASKVGPLPDMTPREAFVLFPLLVLIVWIGVYPHTFLHPIAETSAQWVTLIMRGAAVAAGAP